MRPINSKILRSALVRNIIRALRRFYPSLLQRYVLRQFLSVFFICLFVFVSLFVVFDLFERMNSFIREGSSLGLALTYILYKLPLTIQFMTPIAVLVGVLLSVGRLSQLSEMTAMRACGSSLFSIAKPLLGAGLAISLLTFVSNETLVPYATERVDEIYNLDIKKKAEKGTASRSNFWYRSNDKFYNFGLYDSRSTTLRGISVLELDEDFRLKRRVDAQEATWGNNPAIGWTMKEAIEIGVDKKGEFDTTAFTKLPLVINEEPADFYNLERRAETLTFSGLKKYIAKLRAEGNPTSSYEADLAAKISFPLVNFIVVLIAFPFALIPARSGSLTKSFIAGVSIGFGYYLVHAFSLSLGKGELIPIVTAAWTANILLGLAGIYLMAAAEER